MKILATHMYTRFCPMQFDLSYGRSTPTHIVHNHTYVRMNVHKRLRHKQIKAQGEADRARRLAKTEV